MDLKIEVSEELRQAWPLFRGAAVFATVKNSPYSEELWKRIGEFTELYRQKYTIDSIKEMPAIQATRQAYKKCGKDPSRYRPSSEALCRRLLRGLSLYQIDTLVDLINLASINSGHSIGGFDRDKIQGNKLVLGIGKAGEPYEGIGRGELNIEGMPVYRDAVGGENADKVPFEQFMALCAVTPEAPGVNLLAKVDKQTTLTETGKEVTLSGTEVVTTEVDEIGYPYAVEFELCPDATPNADAILFKGPHSEFVSNWQNTGKFAFRRDGLPTENMFY